MTEEEEEKLNAAAPTDGRRSNPGGDRHGDVPAGFLRAADAQEYLHLPKPRWDYYTSPKRRIITPVVEDGRVHGYYALSQLADLRAQWWARDLAMIERARGHEKEREYRPQRTVVEQATVWDVDGINAVLGSLGWPSASASERTALLRWNPRTDWLVRYKSVILGYGNMRPYSRAARVPGEGRTLDVMEEVLAGRIEGRHARPWMLEQYRPGGEYEGFVGIVLRDVPHRANYARRLISGWMAALFQMAREEGGGIVMRRLWATSDRDRLGPGEPDIGDMARRLGFVEQPNRPGDRVLNAEAGVPAVRYMLDLQTSEATWVRRYRAHVAECRARRDADARRATAVPLSSTPYRLTTRLKDTIQTLLQISPKDPGRDALIVGALNPLIAATALDPRLDDGERLLWGLIGHKIADLQNIESLMAVDVAEEGEGNVPRP